jgi:hypothetical protein
MRRSFGAGRGTHREAIIGRSVEVLGGVWSWTWGFVDWRLHPERKGIGGQEK